MSVSLIDPQGNMSSVRQGKSDSRSVTLSTLESQTLTQLWLSMQQVGQCMWQRFSVKHWVFICSTCASTHHYVSWKTRHQILFKKIHSNSAIERTIYITMEKYLITISVVGKNEIWKIVFFWDDSWFISNRVVNSPNNRRWCYKIPRAVC